MSSGPFQLPKLPYSDTALVPHISANTMAFHYGKHHQAYVDKLNGFITGTDLADLQLEELIKKVGSDPSKVGIFNNAAQVFNHTFYWNSMKPQGGGVPSGKLADQINTTFNGFESFKKQFAEQAVAQFGSGWVWLGVKNNELQIIKTANAHTPITDGITPLITIDVWEHAYYLDYQNKRPSYVDVFLSHLVNWDFAEVNFSESI